jgi:uncharacterized membrane protein
MSLFDVLSVIFFGICWLGYEPVLRRVSGPDSVLNTNMAVVRRAWMANMSARDNRFFDGQLMGHVITSASFFASSNLLLIAAVTGALARGESTWRSVHALPLVEHTVPLLFEIKLALLIGTMARSLLNFIWSIRQMNYCLAAMGAAPSHAAPELVKAYGEATAAILNPALSSFSAGVRGYYFALAAAAWLVGPEAFVITTLGAVSLLVWRQSGSPSAKGVRKLRLLLDAHANDKPTP